MWQRGVRMKHQIWLKAFKSNLAKRHLSRQFHEIMGLDVNDASTCHRQREWKGVNFGSNLSDIIYQWSLTCFLVQGTYFYQSKMSKSAFLYRYVWSICLDLMTIWFALNNDILFSQITKHVHLPLALICTKKFWTWKELLDNKSARY